MKRQLISLFILYSFLNSSELNLGIGVGDIYYPDYLGSNHSNNIIIPFPFIDYHSDKLDIDQNGLKQQLFAIDGLSLRLSMNGSLPVESSGAREGMSNLDPAGEIGPAVVYKLYDKSGLAVKLDFPIRAVISTNFKTNIEYRGYRYDPKLALDYKFLDGYLFQFQTGGIWANSKFHNYIYGIDKRYINKTRFEYRAKAGYSGYKTSLGLSKQFTKVWVGGFMRYYNLTGAIYNNSPLRQQNYAIYSGFFIAYLFDKSLSQKVKNWIE